MKARLMLLLLFTVVAAVLCGLEAAPANGTVAEVYYWKAKPDKLEDYNRYIREYAAPIDREAQRRGAFISVTTYVSQNPASPWTHMRVFILRDQQQFQNLQKALDEAKLRLHPDEQERNRQASYAETLRDAVGHETLNILE